MLNLWLSCQNLCGANHNLQQNYKQHHECFQSKTRVSATLQFLQVLILSNLLAKDCSPLNHVKWNHRCNYFVGRTFANQASIQLWEHKATVTNFHDSSDLRHFFVLTTLKQKTVALDIFLQRMQLFRPRPKPLAEGLLLACFCWTWSCMFLLDLVLHSSCYIRLAHGL